MTGRTSLLWIETVMPEENGQLLVFFRDGGVKKCAIRALVGDDRRFSAILNCKELFDAVKVSVGEYEISWGENLTVADYRLYDSGEQYDFKSDDFKRFAEC